MNLTVSKDLTNLRALLLEYIDGHENLELHLDRGSTCGLIEVLDFVIATAKGENPETRPESLPPTGNVVSIAEARAKRPLRKKI